MNSKNILSLALLLSTHSGFIFPMEQEQPEYGFTFPTKPGQDEYDAIYESETAFAGLAQGGYCYGSNPLVYAAQKNNLDRVRAALAAGLDPSSQNMNGTSALMAAAGHGNLAMVRALLDAGADVNAKPQYLKRVGPNYTALKAAHRSGNQEVIKLLQDRGAQE